MLDTQLSLPAAPEAPAQHRQASRDLVVVIAVTVATFALSAVFELREWLTEVTHPLEHYQIDELPLTFAALALALAWFAWRRWRQSQEELAMRVAAQRALGERETQYRTLFMEDVAGNLLADPDGAIRLCNPAMASLLGLGKAEDALGRPLGSFYADADAWELHRRAALEGRRIDLPCLELRDTGGRPVQAIARILARHEAPGHTGLQAYFADITEQKLMQRELADALAENRRLSQQHLQVQEEERRHIARELHDEMGQCLNAIKLDAVAIRGCGERVPKDVLESAQAIVDASSRLYDVARGLMGRLRPVAMDELGLADALRHLVGQWQRRNSAVACRLELEDDVNGLGESVNITLYRMVQECLTNVTRHANAQNVLVAVRRDERQREVCVVVSDDGRGMQPLLKRTGLGLPGLRERVEALGGRFELVPGTPRGLEVRARIPASEE